MQLDLLVGALSKFCVAATEPEDSCRETRLDVAAQAAGATVAAASASGIWW